MEESLKNHVIETLTGLVKKVYDESNDATSMQEFVQVLCCVAGSEAAAHWASARARNILFILAVSAFKSGMAETDRHNAENTKRKED